MYAHPGGNFPDFDYIPLVRWWQFWRWRLLFNNKDYTLSRASEIILADRRARLMQGELDQCKPMSAKMCQIHFLDYSPDSDSPKSDV